MDSKANPWITFNNGEDENYDGEIREISLIVFDV